MIAKRKQGMLVHALLGVNGGVVVLAAELIEQAWEVAFFFFVLDQNGWFEEDQECFFFLDINPVGEEAGEYWDFGEDWDACFDLDFIDEALAAKHDCALVWDGDGGIELCR